MQSSWIRLVILLALSCALEGCGGTGDSAEVTGSVQLDGQPLAEAEVHFIPQSDTHLGTHAATTDSAGKFTLKRDRNIPVRPGAYAIVVNKFAVDKLALKALAGKGGPPGKGPKVNTVPLIYQKQKTTPLKADIQLGANQLPPFELKSSQKGR